MFQNNISSTKRGGRWRLWYSSTQTALKQLFHTQVECGGSQLLLTLTDQTASLYTATPVSDILTYTYWPQWCIAKRLFQIFFLPKATWIIYFISLDRISRKKKIIERETSLKIKYFSGALFFFFGQKPCNSFLAGLFCHKQNDLYWVASKCDGFKTATVVVKLMHHDCTLAHKMQRLYWVLSKQLTAAECNNPISETSTVHA